VLSFPQFDFERPADVTNSNLFAQRITKPVDVFGPVLG
jgi:hypothetical protein